MHTSYFPTILSIASSPIVTAGPSNIGGVVVLASCRYWDMMSPIWTSVQAVSTSSVLGTEVRGNIG